MVFFLRPILLLFLSSTLQATAVRSVTHYSFPPPFNTPLKLPLATLMEALQDHCETHNYQPQCPSHDHVVVIATATYGRMSKTSKCLTTDFGYTGCKSNVLIQAHHHCSGRPSCLVRLPDGMFENVTVPMCPKDLKMYLSASHHCLPVDLAACSHCYQHSNEKNFALSSSNAGYLASSMSLPSKLHSGCGLDRCPWRVHVKSGQTINLTLYDFGIATLYKNNSNTCYKYGKVLEHAFNRHSPICGGKNVTSHLYTSVSNSLEVVNYLTNASMGQYLIYYQAVGCPDYTTPIASTTKRFADKIIITCNHTLWKSWEVRCVGNKWEGEVGVCPDSAKGVAGLSLSLGVLVAIVLGIALVIGVLIVTVGIVYLKRQQRELLYPPFNPSMPHYLAHDTYYDAMDTKVINTMQRKKHQQQQDFDLQQQMLTLKKQQHLLQEQQQTLDKKAVRKAAKKGKGRGEGGRNVYTKANMEFRPLPSIPSKGSPLEDTTPHPMPPQPSFNPLHPPQTRAAQLATTTTTTTTITTTTAPLPSLTTPPTSFSPPQTNVKRTASPVVQVHVLSSGLPSSASSGTLRKPAKPVRSSSNVKDATPPTPKQPQQTLQPPPQPQPQQSLQQQQQPLQQKQLPQQQQLPLQQQQSQQQQQPLQQQQIPLQQQLQHQLQQPVSQQPLPPSTQHYTMLDPLEVQQLIARLPQQQQPQYHPLLNYQQDPQQQQQQLIQQPFPPPPPLLDSDEELALRPAREGTHLLTNNNNNNNNNNNHNNNNNSNSDCLANSSWP